MAKTLNDIYKKYNISREGNNDANFYAFSLKFIVEYNFVFSDKKAEQTYINLALLLNYLENNQNIFITEDGQALKDKFLKFDINNDNFLLTFLDQISSDPRICLIPNNANRYTTLASNDASTQINEICSKFSENCNPYIGRVMYLLINVEYLVKLLFELKDDKGYVILDSFLRRLLNDINSSLGSINQLTYKIFDNVVTIVEEAPLRYDNLKTEKENKYAKFNIYGVNSTTGGSFVKNVDFNVTITNEFATSVAIGAQANGNQPGQNSTAFSTFNIGLIDRNAKTKSPDNSQDPPSPDNEEKSPEEKFAELKKNYDEALDKMYGETHLVNDETVSSISSLNKDVAQAIIGKASSIDSNNKKEIPAPFFLPFDLNLSMKGLTGMRIFERFALSPQSEQILPSTYRDNNGNSIINFIITDIKHSIKDNVWETQIKGKTVPSENNLGPITPKEPPSIPREPSPTKPQDPPSDPVKPTGACGAKFLGNIPPPIGINDSKRIDAMTKSYNAVFKNFGQTVGMCGQWTYNLAVNYVRVIRNNNNIPQKKLAAGGNAKQNREYWNNLIKLGYTQTRVGSNISKSELANLIKTTPWNYGDVIVYYANDGIAAESHVKYGHTQIYIGNITGIRSISKNKNDSLWATSVSNNYGATFTYGNRDSNCWDFYIFRSPNA